VDPRAAEADRLRSLRARQHGADLGAALALARATSRLADAGDLAAARRALDEVQRAVEAGPPPIANPSLPPGPSLPDRVARVEAALARARGAKDLTKVLRAASPLTGQAEQVLAQSLLSLAYTRHLGDPDTVVLTDDGLAQRHDFGVAADVTAAWVRPADSIESSERRLVGSLMGIDLTLAKLALRRLSETVPAAPSMNTVVLQEVRETVTLAARQPPTDDQLAMVARGIETGRDRVAAAAAADTPTLMELAARAGMSEARRSVIPWMLREEPDRVPELFGLAELYWAGGGGVLPPALGTSASEIDGCWCLQVPRPRPWEDVAGRPGMPLVAARVVDLGLAMAVHMHALGIPARLFPAVLAFAAGEYVGAAALRYAEDWHALTHAAAAIPRERVEDYVSGLTGDGPLRRREQATR
jgi:hypothetical protein